MNAHSNNPGRLDALPRFATALKAIESLKPIEPLYLVHPDKFAGAAHNYSLVAQKGDVAAAKTAFYQMGATCKACHEQFRKEDH